MATAYCAGTSPSDRLRHKQGPGDLGHGAPAVHRGPTKALERVLSLKPYRRMSAPWPARSPCLVEPGAEAFHFAEAGDGQVECGRQLAGRSGLSR